MTGLYRFVEKIGGGGVGVIYGAEDTPLRLLARVKRFEREI
jgi:hypothetical protein